MRAFKAVIGYVGSFFGFKKIDEINSSELGYRFEHNEIVRIIRRLKNFETVTITDAHGASLDESSIESRKGADGGIDCVIRIISTNRKRSSYSRWKSSKYPRCARLLMPSYKILVEFKNRHLTRPMLDQIIGASLRTNPDAKEVIVRCKSAATTALNAVNQFPVKVHIVTNKE